MGHNSIIHRPPCVEVGERWKQPSLLRFVVHAHTTEPVQKIHGAQKLLNSIFYWYFLHTRTHIHRNFLKIQLKSPFCPPYTCTRCTTEQTQLNECASLMHYFEKRKQWRFRDPIWSNHYPMLLSSQFQQTSIPRGYICSGKTMLLPIRKGCSERTTGKRTSEGKQTSFAITGFSQRKNPQSSKVYQHVGQLCKSRMKSFARTEQMTINPRKTGCYYMLSRRRSRRKITLNTCIAWNSVLCAKWY